MIDIKKQHDDNNDKDSIYYNIFSFSSVYDLGWWCFFVSELIMIVITGFASTWKSLKIAVGAGKFLNFNNKNFKGTGANTERPSG